VQNLKSSQSANLAVILTCLLAFSALLSGSWKATAQDPATEGRKPSRQTPLEVLNGTATLVGHYEPSNMLRLAVVLTVPHPVEERQFLEDIQNKQSPLFHQFLSAEEWNARFGPSVENEQAVIGWAKSEGLTVTHRYNNRLVVDLEGQAGVIEKALHVTINSYILPAADADEARMVYSNDRDPVLPDSLDGVVSAVLGLNSIEVARPAGGSGRLVPRPDYLPGPVVQELDSSRQDASGEAGALIANEMGMTSEVTRPSSKYRSPAYYWSSKAYDYQALMNQGHCCNPLNNKSGHSPRESSIAIASFADVSLTDVANFAQEFGLAWYVNKIAIDGAYTCNNTQKTPDDGCVEVTMDTEWSLATANGQGADSDTARVVVYEGSNYNNAIIMDVYAQMADDAHARTMSTSWALEENTQGSSNPELDTYNSTMQSVDKVFSSMVGQGWTLVASSGDEGATAGCTNKLAIDFPASDPNVVGVGGTDLAGAGYTIYEGAWTGSAVADPHAHPNLCQQNDGGSGGGFSEYWPAPSYQSLLGFSKRAVPDMALDAPNGHDVYFNRGWIYQGGTSVSAPMLAGFFAQENAYLLSIGNKCGPNGASPCAPLGNANYPIYYEASYRDAGHSPFYDIVFGCNSNDITAEYPDLGYYCAGPGYDEVTGWGSANMLQLAWAINWELTSADGLPYVTFSGPPINKWYNTNQAVSWTINDYAGDTPGIPGTGIAGLAQGWDANFDEPASEAHGGSGNLFYSGPQFPNSSQGCLSFVKGECSGGVSQGCHTAYARGWNNQGWNTAGQPGYPETYGPICYDTVPPTIKVTNNPAPPAGGIYKTSVTVTLQASDPGGSKASGVANIYYAISTPACGPKNLGACSIYSGPIGIKYAGTWILTAFSQDKAGNFSSVKTETIKLATNPPPANAKLSLQP